MKMRTRILSFFLAVINLFYYMPCDSAAAARKLKYSGGINLKNYNYLDAKRLIESHDVISFDILDEKLTEAIKSYGEYKLGDIVSAMFNMSAEDLVQGGEGLSVLVQRLQVGVEGVEGGGRDGGCVDHGCHLLGGVDISDNGHVADDVGDGLSYGDVFLDLFGFNSGGGKNGDGKDGGCGEKSRQEGRQNSFCFHVMLPFWKRYFHYKLQAGNCQVLFGRIA